MTAALVPLERVRFGGGRRWPTPPVVLGVEPLPRNTMDPRYEFCQEHRVACVCREAEMAENLNEYSVELNDVREAALDVLVGHRLYDFDTPHLVDGLACQCTGCRLIRIADIGGLARHVDEHGVIEPRHSAAAVARRHRQGGRPDRSWGCVCGWVQDKPHREHVADMVAAATAEAAAGES